MDVVNQKLTADQAKEVHAAMDVDRNGLVSMDEVSGFVARMQKESAESHFSEVLGVLDGNYDSKLSLEEILQDAEDWQPNDDTEKAQAEQQRAFETAKFQAADANGDNFLDFDE